MINEEKIISELAPAFKKLQRAQDSNLKGNKLLRGQAALDEVDDDEDDEEDEDYEGESDDEANGFLDSVSRVLVWRAQICVMNTIIFYCQLFW